MAIKLALNYIHNTVTSRSNLKKLHIFSDSQSAIGQLTLGWESSSHKSTIKEVNADLQKLKQSGIEVEISWTPGHSDIQGNEYADQMAKEAAHEAKEKREPTGGCYIRRR